jgi:hypothetical protein
MPTIQTHKYTEDFVDVLMLRPNLTIPAFCVGWCSSWSRLRGAF